MKRIKKSYDPFPQIILRIDLIDAIKKINCDRFRRHRTGKIKEMVMSRFFEGESLDTISKRYKITRERARIEISRGVLELREILKGYKNELTA